MINDEDIKSKLLILFILEKLEMPINEDILLQMCSLDNNWIPYLCFTQYIAELKSAGFINHHLNDNTQECVLSLSEDGKVCLSHFFGEIYKSRRDDVIAYIRAMKLNYRKQQEFICNYTKSPDGTYKVVCAILDVETPVMEVSFSVPSLSKAVTVRNKWQTKAPDFFRDYTDLLIDN